MSDFKKVEMPKRKFDQDKRQQIVENLMKRVDSAEKRRRIIRLAGVMSEGKEYSDEFFAALHYYSMAENDTRLERDFQRFAAGGSSGLEGVFEIDEPSARERSERSRRGRGN